MQSCPRAATHTAALLSPAARDDLRAAGQVADPEIGKSCADSQIAAGNLMARPHLAKGNCCPGDISLSCCDAIGRTCPALPVVGRDGIGAPAEVSRYPSQTSGQCPNKFCSALFRNSILSPGYDVDPDISEYQGIASQSVL